MVLDLDGHGPRHRQVYRALRTRILDGTFPAGSRLPATRTLAQDLRLSRNTILEAFEQLRVEGYLTGRVGSGSYVPTELPDSQLAVDSPSRSTSRSPDVPAPLSLSHAARRLEQLAPRADRLTWSIGKKTIACDFRYGAPSFDDFPMATWSRIAARRLRRASITRLSYGSPEGCPELRKALSAYLARSRGVRCEPDQIVLTHGTQQAINLVADVLLDAGDRVAVEEPHYTGFTLPLSARGVRLVFIDTDGHGLRIDQLERRKPVKLVCVTPSHQFPGGSLMPLRRRLELLELAGRHGSAILEDDYDSEFRYDGRPVESLQGLDAHGRVLYVGSASKLLYPALRVGWLVVPEPLVDPFRRAKAVADTGTAPLDQLVLADFIDGGHLDRHLRRQRVRNAERRATLLDAIRAEFGDAAQVVGAQAGLHVLLWFPEVASAHESAVRRHCLSQGVGVYPARTSFHRPPAELGFLLGYASLDGARIRRGIRVLGQAVRAIAEG